MRKNLVALLSLVMLFSVIPGVLAVSVGSGVSPDIITEDFAPKVWMCDDRVVYDDATEPGRISEDGEEMLERMQNYAFEGEQIRWRVLVLDKNGIEKVQDVFVTIGSVQGAGNDIEANCKLSEVLDENDEAYLDESCNAQIGQANLEDIFRGGTAAYYDCTFTVETPDSMYDEYWVTVEALDLDGLSGTMDENEYWFFNPIISLTVDGDMVFDNVRPGTNTTSSSILVGNEADVGSGVMLDMFISGTDFYDSASSGAMCPDTNQLALENFKYYATNGAYSTKDDSRSDVEGYVPINYGIGFNDPNPFYNTHEIIQGDKYGPSNRYYSGNVLSPGSEIAMNFRLSLPEPCNGDFDTGDIYFWGEAV